MFKPAGWPETCYVQEAVYWVAMGRVPEFIFTFEDENDARLGGEALQMAEVIGGGCDRFFHPIEFAWVGVKSFDYDRYADAPSGPSAFHDIGHTKIVEPSEHLRLWEEQAASTADTEEGIFYEEHLINIRRQVADYEWRMEMESAFDPIIEPARVRVLQALMAGDVRALGLVQVVDGNPDYDEFAVTDIPADKWRMDFDWENSRLSVAGIRYNAVQVKTDDLLKIFNKPCCEPLLSTKVDIYPGVAIISDDADEAAISEAGPRRIGRPKRDGGTVEPIVRRWVADQIKRGLAPEKKESLVTEAIAFASDILRHTVSRTNMQRFLEGVQLPKSPRRNAQKSAHNSPENTFGK